MPATASGLIVEDDDARPGFELCHRCFIGAKRVALQQMPGQTIDQRLQGCTGVAQPIAPMLERDSVTCSRAASCSRR